ncbi:MAG TPA: alpha-L-fucosidase [Gemmatimonadales bacterium]|nr:alpha-L-fucosidase [Gemmatimonadales bacterium]
MRRRTFLASSSAALLGARHLSSQGRARPRPTPAQLTWQRDELALFAHFGVNTFTDREWGDGTESPAIFDPSAFDARQWTRAAKVAGFRALVLTAKHHDGFCLWPTATTQHSVAASPVRGDVVQAVADACRADGLRLGLYLSPWDRNAAVYGSDRYSDFYCDQLTELLTRYGPVHEVWFDGANGEGPSGKRQVYDWPRFWGLVKRLQPDAVIFSDAGPDVRWIGNERGVAGETNWSTVDPDVVPVPGMSGDAVMRMLQEGDPDGSVWRPGETDTSIRPGWFYHAAEDDRVRSVDDLVRLYDTSVGRNSKLLLNVPPTRAGRLHETDVARLAGMRAALDARDADPLVAGTVRADGDGTQVTLRPGSRVGRVVLREPIEQGQHVAGWRLLGRTNGAWQPLARGTTIGYQRAIAIDPCTVDALRLDIVERFGGHAAVSIAAFAS